MGMKEGLKIMVVGLLIIIICLLIGVAMDSWAVIILGIIIVGLTIMGGFSKFIGVT